MDTLKYKFKSYNKIQIVDEPFLIHLSCSPVWTFLYKKKIHVHNGNLVEDNFYLENVEIKHSYTGFICWNIKNVHGFLCDGS